MTANAVTITTEPGTPFIDIVRAAWNCDGLDRLVAACDGAIVYPVAVGIVSAAHAIPLAPAMHAFLHALTSNWISAGARLIPLGQTDSQRALAALEPAVVAVGKRAIGATLDDLGSATFRADLASMAGDEPMGRGARRRRGGGRRGRRRDGRGRRGDVGRRYCRRCGRGVVGEGADEGAGGQDAAAGDVFGRRAAARQHSARLHHRASDTAARRADRVPRRPEPRRGD